MTCETKLSFWLFVMNFQLHLLRANIKVLILSCHSPPTPDVGLCQLLRWIGLCSDLLYVENSLKGVIALVAVGCL